MVQQKTIENESSVEEFINSVENEKKRDDTIKLIEIIKQVTGIEPKMWGTSIVGFGSYHYIYDSGHEGDTALVGLSPRKAAITLYLYPDFESKETLLSKLGKHKVGKGCIYIKKLEDINIEILKQLVVDSIAFLKTKYTMTE